MEFCRLLLRELETAALSDLAFGTLSRFDRGATRFVVYDHTSVRRTAEVRHVAVQAWLLVVWALGGLVLGWALVFDGLVLQLFGLVFLDFSFRGSLTRCGHKAAGAGVVDVEGRRSRRTHALRRVALDGLLSWHEAVRVGGVLEAVVGLSALHC